MMAKNKQVDEATGTDFVGHEWDGIEELDTPMPRWWVWTFYLTIIWGIVYLILYPAWPMVNSATKGVLGWTSRGELAAEMSALEKERAPILKALADIPLKDLPANERLMQTAIQGGQAAFKTHCVQCHGSGAAGSKGYPNLNDDEWLWGGDMKSIQYSIVNGIRNPDHADTRFSQMPAFGDILSAGEIDALTLHVLNMSGKSKPVANGAALYEQNCAVCHGADGKGDRAQGAPSLTDAISLYGNDSDSIRQSISKSRQGVMPRWNDKLDPVTIKMLTAFVWSRGGGEQPVSSEVDTVADASATGAENAGAQ